jgi:carbonic anhydrase/acetyltransferase-like protein (isoleucine patch superfamily)
MLRTSVVGDTPNIDRTAFVDPSAIIIGRATIGPQCYIGPGVVIRADRFSTDDAVTRIVIGKNCTIQDLAVMHVHAGNSIEIGDETFINHGAVIHGTTVIGKNCFIGAKSVISNATIGERVFVRLFSAVEEVTIESERFVEVNTMVVSQDVATRLRPITVKERELMERANRENREYAVRYKYSLEK